MPALLARPWCFVLVVVSCSWVPLLPGADARRAAFASHPSLRASPQGRSTSSSTSCSRSCAASAGESRRSRGSGGSVYGSGEIRRHPPAITGRTATPTPTMSVSLRRRRYYPRWGRQQNQNQNQNQQEGTARGNPPLTYRPSSGQQQRPQRQQHLNRFASDSSATSAALTASPASQAGGGDPEREDGPGTDERATSTKAAVAPRKRFNGLLADRFQHPFDLEATGMLRRLPGLELAIRGAVPAIEDAVFMDNIANSILVGPRQMGSLHGLLLEACRILDMEAPDLYIRQNPTPNAYTLAIRGKKPFIVLHTSLVDLMEPEEVQAVIAHELGHLKCEHGIWVTLATVLANGLYRGGFLGAFVAERLGLRRRLMRWSRAAEFTCDRAAMLVSQDVNVVVSTLLKLAGGSVSQASELSVPEFLKQASAYDLASQTRIGRLLKREQSMELTHPLPVIRARELVKFSQSPQYLGLVRRGLPL